MCKHDKSRLSCQNCIDEWKVKSSYMSERGKKGYAAKVAAGYTFRPYAGRRRCKECQVFTTELRCSTCKRPTRALPVMARHRIHYVDQNVDSLPKRSYPDGKGFCERCGIMVDRKDTHRGKKGTRHNECNQQVRFNIKNSNRPDHLKKRGDALPRR